MARTIALTFAFVTGLASAAIGEVRPAAAQGVPEDEARPLIEAGLADLRARRYEQALAAFLEAFDVLPAPEVEARIGLAEQGLERWVDAEIHLKNALRAASDPWVEKNRPALEKAVSDLEGKLGWLIVEGSPKDAIVKVDDIERGVLPRVGPLRVTAQAHEVTATLGTASRSTQARVVARGTATVNMVVPVPGQPPAPLTISRQPDPAPPPAMRATPAESSAARLRTEPSAWYRSMAWTSLLPAVTGTIAGAGLAALATNGERCPIGEDCPDSPGLFILGIGSMLLSEGYGLLNLFDLMAPAPMFTTSDGRRRKVAEWLGIGAALGMGATSYLLIDNDGYGSSYRKNLGFANIPLAVLAATTSLGALITPERRVDVSATVLVVPGFVGAVGMF